MAVLKLKKVDGRWRGTYAYQGLEKLANREPVAFTLILKQGWFGHFAGSVTEDTSRGMPGTGMIVGDLSFPRITFTKHMPVFCVSTPDGRILTLRQFLIEKGHTCQRDMPHPPVVYDGLFSSQERARGTWIIRADTVFLAGQAVQMPEVKGAWDIERCGV